MTFKNLTKRALTPLMGINPLVQDLKQIRSQLETQSNIVHTPVPQQWEDFVSLCTIRSGGNMVQFKPYEYQKLLVNLMHGYNNIVIAKSRQLGTTQTIVSKFLHDTSLNAASSSVCFMRNGDDVGSLSRRIKQMLQGLKDYVTPHNDSVGYIKLKNLGDIYIKNSSREGIRSLDSITNQLYDESAFIENIEQIYSASSAASALVGDSISKLIVSTPSAKSGWYWSKLNENNGDLDVEEICKAVAAGELYKDIPGVYWWVDTARTLKLILHWKCHPIYNQRSDYLEYRQQQDGTDEETIQREYNLAFIDASVNIFSSNLVREAIKGEFEAARDKKANYYIGVDTATTGADYCVATVVKEVDGKYSVVCLYRKRQQTSEYNLYQIGDLINRYKPTIIGIEVTGGVGQVWLERLIKDFPDSKFQAIRTTGESKPVMISTLQLALEKQIITFPKGCVIEEELLSFRKQGKRLEAANGKHDDTVMALSFSLFVAERANKEWDIFDIPRIIYDR